MKNAIPYIIMASCAIFSAFAAEEKNQTPAAKTVSAEPKNTLPDLKSISEGAKKGDAMMEGIYSELLRRGAMGAEQNYEGALEYAEKSSAKNDPVGLYNMAVITEHGLFVKQDVEKANELYKKARPGLEELAAKNNAWALYDLGYMQLKGKGGTENKAEAVKTLEKAAMLGHSGAQYCLGYVYHHGEPPVEKNEDLAFKWLFEAAKQNEPQAQYLVGLYFLKNKPQVKNMCPDAHIWLQKAAEQGEPNAQFALALIYEQGKGGKTRYSRGVQMVQQSRRPRASRGAEKNGRAYGEG